MKDHYQNQINTMYKDKSIDSSIRKDFQNNPKYNYLQSIEVSGGGIRGLHPSKVEFKYPITAIAGVNGSGKSTLLALVSCAFHNTSSFVPFNKNSNYYTYSDFFVFAPEEKGLVSQIEIKSTYLTDFVPAPPKIKGEDIRKKKPSGKWNDYNTRPERVVSFLGINRILPPSEDSKYRGYRSSFKETKIDEKIKSFLSSSLTSIFGQGYTDIKLKEYKNCKLFYVTNINQYTGYNMGAGENAVLTLLYEILTAGEGALIVVDEIELGIHVSAQKKLIDVLKELCKKNHCQGKRLLAEEQQARSPFVLGQCRLSHGQYGSIQTNRQQKLPELLAEMGRIQRVEGGKRQRPLKMEVYLR